MEAIIFWWPAYRLAGAIKLFTAIVSWVTVLSLFRIVSRVLTMRTREELEAEIASRRQVETQLQKLNADLERRVQERTCDLTESNAALQQSELREKERALELETVLPATPTPIWISDEENCETVTGNPALYRLLNMSEDSNVWATQTDTQERTFKNFVVDCPCRIPRFPCSRLQWKALM